MQTIIIELEYQSWCRFMDDNLYYAREGQTVKQIAEEHGEDPAELVMLNKKKHRSLTATSRLRDGAQIRLPGLANLESPEQSTRQKRVAETDVYSAEDDETLKQIADKLNVDLTLLLTLNKPRYKGLTSGAKLQEGTSIIVPLDKGTQPKSSKKQKTNEAPDDNISDQDVEAYSAEDDETLKHIADKLDVKVSLLLTLNKPRYKGLTTNAKLQEGTSIVVPVNKGTQPKSSKKQKRTPETPIINIPEEDTKDYSAVEDETLKQIAAKINVELSILLTLNKPRYKGLTTAAKLQEGTLIAYPASHELPAPVVEEELETLPWSISHDAKEVYLAKDNETLKQIASKLHVDVNELLKLNEEKYSGLSIHAKLQRGTVILTPCCESAAGSYCCLHATEN